MYFLLLVKIVVMNLRYSDEIQASQILIGKGIRDSSKTMVSQLVYASK